MLVAQEKRKQNIAEYILYMYQVEDLIRAFKFDMNLIESQLVSRYRTDDQKKKEIAAWYENLVLMMGKEQIREKGHLQFLLNLMDDLNELHLKLMDTGQNPSYVMSFNSVAGLVQELKGKNPSGRHDVDLAITAIYGFLLLKMQQKEVSSQTTLAIRQLSKWLSDLSRLYLEFEKGDLEF